ncbi:hypothetical protein Fmac_026039 [Flemingia macrophylla]|uniref:Uncharacterized protein n=1 Tax=Flemingia macrophylla TaxID=520843 RepID=A0ABD1LDQ1_9FABA
MRTPPTALATATDRTPHGVENDATAKKSFFVATGELFLGLAKQMIKSSNEGSSPAGVSRSRNSRSLSSTTTA